ncbi:MAG: DUF4097 family beta strand repeat protein [Candidatus Eremiobacteraeota bacterium]|nr:DUF4097 family beta strand repeat protein [Candidatus Eremiobacteraeota bacterium]
MSRASVIAMLVAAEILIAGMAIYTVGGRASFTHGMQRVDFTPATIAPVAAGATPHVVIDDASSRVSVTASNDALVHVRDLTQIRGNVFSTSKYPQLRVTRTSDGVRIERPAFGSLSMEIFSFSTEAIEVAVPGGSHVEIPHCSGADVNGIAGNVAVDSQDGHVTLRDMRGDVDARSDDGYLSLTDVTTGSLIARTHDGRIEARGLTVAGERPNATLHSDDGSVHVAGAFASNGAYEITSGDGSIELRLPSNADLAITASTGDGRIVLDGSSLDRDDSGQRTIRLGAGSSAMKLATSDGSIHILTNGASLQ